MVKITVALDADTITGGVIAAGAITSSEAPALANLDAAVSTRAVPGDAMDLVANAVDAAALASDALAEINAALSAVHGAGSWEGDSAAAIDAVLTAAHGAGSWKEPALAADWTAAERAQIRDALGVDGAKTPAVGGQLQAMVAAAAEAVWTRAVSGDLDDTKAGGALNKVLLASWARQELDIAGNRLKLYDRAGTTLLGYWPMLDADGAPLAKLVGAPARRGAFT